MPAASSSTPRPAGLLTALALFIHNFPEGLATFVGALADTKIGVGLGEPPFVLLCPVLRVSCEREHAVSCDAHWHAKVGAGLGGAPCALHVGPHMHAPHLLMRPHGSFSPTRHFPSFLCSSRRDSHA